MKQYKYTGTFISQDTHHSYELTVMCNGFLQAFFLLTADAIKSGRHYQLNSIRDDKLNVYHVDDIIKCDALLIPA